MAVFVTPHGIETEQAPGESIDNLEERLKNIPEDYRDNSKGKFEFGHEIGSIYKNWINSYEGQEYIKYAKEKGRGSSRPGSIDKIRTIRAGEGLVAATTPDALEKRLIVNKDFIYEFATIMANALDLTIVQGVELAIAHELGHNDIQGPHERRGSEKQVEYNNDFAFVDLYTRLAKKDVNNSDLYLKKAIAFTLRYDGRERKTMDDMILKTYQQLSKSYDMYPKETYRQAA
jgi:hypothetical protein